MIDEALVQKWLTELSDRIRARTEELERLREEIEADRRREAALRALLGEPTLTALVTVKEGPGPSSGTSPPPVHPIERGVVEVLEERGKPTHVADIRAELGRRGIPVPGKGSDANVIVYLARAPQVCRVGRGLYALRTWGVPEVPPRRRRARSSRRRAPTKTR